MSALTQKTANASADLDQSQRLDVWLFRTRLLKSRSLATRMILDGHVRLTRNGLTERITKPGTKIRPGNSVVFMRGETLIHVKMLAAPKRRGPAPEAREHYKQIPLDMSLGG